MLYETVLEVLLHDPATRESVVLAAWGEKADWYRNIELTPALEIRTSSERYVPEQRFLAPEENHAVLLDYARRHPLAFQIFASVRLPARWDRSCPQRGCIVLTSSGLLSQR